MTAYLVLVLAGVLSGFLAGLLGIGGGLVMVPVLMLMLPAVGIDPAIVPKVAVATSLAAMIPTACSAVLAQYRRGALDTRWVRRLGPAAAVGAVIGSQLAAAASGRWVAIGFAVYAGWLALRVVRGAPVNSNVTGCAARAVSALPAPAIGALIGAFASIAGVGGASLTVPYLLAAGVEMKRAVAVSSAVGLAIALAGGASFATASAAMLSTSSSELVGLVHFPAALMIAVSAALLAPPGVSAAHRISVVHLKRAFAAVLIAASAVTLTKATDAIGMIHYAASIDLAQVAQR
ncbi:MAG TPA: sulfite exporter TauE/SafE family protein [Burkholderiaceae bacterium]|nr:sulfite exporter TauE/SafE family protein [Burkholderiaceae bacterium]